MADDPVQTAIENALTGFLQGTKIQSSFSGTVAPPAVPVTFTAVPPLSEVHFPVVPAIPSLGSLGLPGRLSAGSLAPTQFQVAPALDVTWKIQDENGNDITPEQGLDDDLFHTVSTLKDNQGTLVDPTTVKPFSVVFHLHTHELTYMINPIELRHFQVSLTITATVHLPLPDPASLQDDTLEVVDKMYSKSLTLPSIPVAVPSVGIPKLAVLCNFASLGTAMVESSLARPARRIPTAPAPGYAGQRSRPDLRSTRP